MTMIDSPYKPLIYTCTMIVFTSILVTIGLIFVLYIPNIFSVIYNQLNSSYYILTLNDGTNITCKNLDIDYNRIYCDNVIYSPSAYKSYKIISGDNNE